MKAQRKEVDFHHKIAYRFEKIYRLKKTNPERKKILDLDIIKIINEHSDYLESDPMALFYCLFFCIFYDNSNLVVFLKSLINKLDKSSSLEADGKVSSLIYLIDEHGIERIRERGE